jgi:hypothetical protein
MGCLNDSLLAIRYSLLLLAIRHCVTIRSALMQPLRLAATEAI